MRSIAEIQAEILQLIADSKSKESLLAAKSFALGKNGQLRSLLSELPNMPVESRRSFGIEVNSAISQIEIAINDKMLLFNQMDEVVDVSVPSRPEYFGTSHVINDAITKLIAITSTLGFESVEGAEIDSEFFIFDALNTPKYHPARDMQSSFYMNDGRLLRTHTSSVQIHEMQNRKPPLSIVSAGRVYRNDNDATHTPMFHQIEGLHVAEDVNVAHLKYIVETVLNEFFESNLEIRFRPSFFPFTEPSMEVDVKIYGKWLEIMGCGMVHQKVFDAVQYKNISGFAFGMGIERLVMVKYGISTIRHFFENNLDWLDHYSSF